MTKLLALAPGFVLGRYELVLRLASGGMGEIWAARLRGSHGFQKVVAVKALLPELSRDPSVEQMFLDEAALASRLKHPNVVHVIDLGEDEAVLYQVMEWVNGESLGSLMQAAAKRDGIPISVAARIVCQVCAGLHAAHELRSDDGEPLGLVHRDLSPENVLITTDGVAKVVDFGVAKYRGRGVSETRVGTLRGTVAYMAPEHALGQPVDRRADVFALGILLYQLVSGVHPFLGDDARLTLSRISSPTPAVPLRSRMPSVSPRLSRLVANALAESPEARTASAADLMRAIEEAVPEAGVQSADALVADCLRRVAGESVDRRAKELREALLRLDESNPLPMAPRVGARRSSERPKPITTVPPSLAPPKPIARALLPSERPKPITTVPPPLAPPKPIAKDPSPSEPPNAMAKTPPYGTPSRPPPGPKTSSVTPTGVTTASNASDVDAAEMFGEGARASLLRRRVGAVAVGAVVVVGLVIALAMRGAPGDEPVRASRSSASSEVVPLPTSTGTDVSGMGTGSAVEKAAPVAPVPPSEDPVTVSAPMAPPPGEAAAVEAPPRHPAADRPAPPPPAPPARGAGASDKTPASPPTKVPVARKPGRGSREFTPTGL